MFTPAGIPCVPEPTATFALQVIDSVTEGAIAVAVTVPVPVFSPE